MQISSLKLAPLNSIVNVIGVVSSTYATSIVHRSDDSKVPKKTISLWDMSVSSIDVTLWGAHCHTEGRKLSTLHMECAIPIFVIKGGWVVEFNGQTTRTIPTTYLVINPYIVETRQLRE